MAELQKQFRKFEENIRLSDIDDNKPLRDKRDLLIKELKEWGKKNEKPGFDWFNQGSYHMSTGIKPMEGDDYDIDVAIVYDINIDDYEDPTEVKKWVRDALKRNNREVEILTPCVRVQYREKGEPKNHVDFAVYGKELNWNNDERSKQISKGREFSSFDNRVWEESEPKRLRELIKDEMFQSDKELGGQKRTQFRRNVRYLKRWKDNNFSSNGNQRPTGIAMTAICHEWFKPLVSKDWEGNIVEKDLESLLNVVRTAVANNCGLNVKLPVIPHNDLFEKLKESDHNEENYKKKLKELKKTLEVAWNEPDPHEASKILRKVFGEDFPVPEKKETAKKTAYSAITTSSSSG